MAPTRVRWQFPRALPETRFVQKMSVTAPPATRGKRQMIRKREVNH